jgi:ABC-type oligopeptide transport system ATPase subunit
MNKGAIVEAGTSDEILNAPKNQYTKTLISAIPHFVPAQM